MLSVLYGASQCVEGCLLLSWKAPVLIAAMSVVTFFVICSKIQVEIVLGILYTLVGSAAVFGNLCAIYYFTTIDKSKKVCLTNTQVRGPLKS